MKDSFMADSLVRCARGRPRRRGIRPEGTGQAWGLALWGWTSGARIPGTAGVGGAGPETPREPCPRGRSWTVPGLHGPVRRRILRVKGERDVNVVRVTL